MKVCVLLMTCLLGIAVGLGDVRILNGEEPVGPSKCARVCAGTTGKETLFSTFEEYHFST